jgi:subtilase family serine protease
VNRRILAVVVSVTAAMSAVIGTAQAAPVAAQVAACAEPAPGFTRCLTSFTPQANGVRAKVSELPSGIGANDLASAYRIPKITDANTLIGIAIAYDAPNLEVDLNVYRAQYGLPPCTTENGCFRKVNQNGDPGPLPVTNYGWAVESTLDVSMASAGCPTCPILVVEGNSPSFPDLAAAVDTAARLGAKVVSNSYGARETGMALSYAASYNHPGTTIVVSSGDIGFTSASFPAVFDNVVAVGGTTLVRDESERGWAESAWLWGGSGCSAYIAKPAWQRDTSCAKRTTTDISAVASGLAIYSTESGGWMTVDGTSASAPFIAGLYGASGHATTAKPADLYRSGASFFDITTGTNDPLLGGAKCGNDYLCVAKPGYDAPTGVGTPNGLTAF